MATITDADVEQAGTGDELPSDPILNLAGPT